MATKTIYRLMQYYQYKECQLYIVIALPQNHFGTSFGIIKSH